MPAMHKQTRTIVLISLAALMVLGTMLSGCGAKQAAKATQEPAAEAPDMAKAPATQVPGAGGGQAAHDPWLQDKQALKDLLKLAPLHVTCSVAVTQNGEQRVRQSYVADLDAKGNARMTDTKSNRDTYLIDGKEYWALDGKFEYTRDEEPHRWLAQYYGAPYTSVYGLLGEVKPTLVGPEAVAPWQTKKYKVNYDPATTTPFGKDWQAFAWVEDSTGVVVKVVIEWTTKADSMSSASGDVHWHGEFLATPGTVTEIALPK